MWIKILQLIVSLSLLVIIHELGHFMFAKMFKCRVEKFYLFFNPWFSIFKFKIGETTYGMGWVPFGGYVKISGMIDESMDTEQMKQPAKPYEFRSKPAWQRLLMMVGGVAMNVIFAAIIYIGISFHYGQSYISPKDAKYGFEFSELAQSMGFRNGDKVISVDGKYIDDSADILKSIVLDNAEYVEVERAGQQVRVAINPDSIGRILKDKSFITVGIPFVIDSVMADGGASRGGILAGDTVLAINGRETPLLGGAMAIIGENKSQSIAIEVARDSAGMRQVVSRQVEVSDNGKIGVALTLPGKLINVSTRNYTIVSAIPAGIKRAGDEISSYAKQLKMILSPKTEAYKSLGGFIAIGNIFPDTWDWFSFWNITAFLSIILAVMNILPIPALDGGHIMFLLYEVITRRRPSDKFLERAQIVGLVLLFALLLYANGNDVFKLLTKWFN